jgi:hypothetical protein
MYEGLMGMGNKGALCEPTTYESATSFDRYGAERRRHE